MKVCKTCNIAKDESEFYKSNTGIFPECKSCSIIRARKWQINNKERAREIDRKRNRTDRRRTQHRINWSKKQCDGKRDKVKSRDNYICLRCDITEKQHLRKFGEGLHVHHIDRDRENNDLSNLEILCANCHAIEHWS